MKTNYIKFFYIFNQIPNLTSNKFQKKYDQNQNEWKCSLKSISLRITVEFLKFFNFPQGVLLIGWIDAHRSRYLLDWFIVRKQQQIL